MQINQGHFDSTRIRPHRSGFFTGAQPPVPCCKLAEIHRNSPKQISTPALLWPQSSSAGCFPTAWPNEHSPPESNRDKYYYTRMDLLQSRTGILPVEVRFIIDMKDLSMYGARQLANFSCLFAHSRPISLTRFYDDD